MDRGRQQERPARCATISATMCGGTGSPCITHSVSCGDLWAVWQQLVSRACPALSGAGCGAFGAHLCCSREPSWQMAVRGHLSQGAVRAPPSMGPSVLPMPQPRERMAIPRACSVGLQLSASSVLTALRAARQGGPAGLLLTSVAQAASSSHAQLLHAGPWRSSMWHTDGQTGTVLHGSPSLPPAAGASKTRAATTDALHATRSPRSSHAGAIEEAADHAPHDGKFQRRRQAKADAG